MGVGCHFLLQGNLPNPGTEPVYSASPALAGGFSMTVPRDRIPLILFHRIERNPQKTAGSSLDWDQKKNVVIMFSVTAGTNDYRLSGLK